MARLYFIFGKFKHTNFNTMTKFRLLLMSLVLGCMTTCGLAQTKKVAVVTFFANKKIDVTTLGNSKINEALLGKVLQLRDNPKFDLNTKFNQFHDTFFNTYAKSFPFELLPENTVTSLPAYQAFQPKVMGFSTDSKDYLLPPGYQYIHDGAFGSYNEESMTAMFAPMADGVMFVHIIFKYEKDFGFGGLMTYKIKAYARISLYNNKTGKKIFAINETGTSKKTFTEVAGIPTLDADDMLPACQQAMDDLMEDLNKKLEKIAKKAGEKL